MKTFMKLYMALVMVLAAGAIYAKVFEVENAYIKIGVDDNTGRYILETIQGDPENVYDDNQQLLYKKIPPTSMTTVYIDDEPYIFGSSSGYFRKRAEVVGNKIVTEWSIKGVVIIQEVEIVKGPSTGLMDSMRVLYRIKNENAGNVKVGLRIMFDTFLGDKDGAAFSLPDLGDISHEAQFYRDSIPAYWYSFDSFVNPLIKTQGILKGFGVTTPDKIVFASWDRLYDNLWDFVVDSNKEFKRVGTGHYDSAIALYYEPVVMGPNEMMYISSIYGLYGATMFSSQDLALTISIPAEPKNPPIPVSVDIKNMSETSLDKVTLKITFPKGFSLAEGEKDLVEFVKVGAGESKKGLWNLTCSSIGGNFNITVKATGEVNNNSQEVIAQKSFKMNYVENLVVADKDVQKDLENKIEQKIVAATNTNKTVAVGGTNKIVNNVVIPDKPKVQKDYVLSQEELDLISEIEELDKLLENINKKYEVMIEIYKNAYLTNMALVNIDNDILQYANRLLDEEIKLSNQKAALAGEK
ncbi:MAG: hypothetical protein A2Y33_00520 [Spirochaetes bacterium GWF1_51_8]|nr:MAG: hypothetical protein A2Y33_00520 [Spirochaetes bacterium GWF1_51_8]